MLLLLLAILLALAILGGITINHLLWLAIIVIVIAALLAHPWGGPRGPVV